MNIKTNALKNAFEGKRVYLRTVDGATYQGKLRSVLDEWITIEGGSGWWISIDKIVSIG